MAPNNDIFFTVRMFDTQLSDFDYDSVIFYKPETINLSDSQNVFRKIKICVKNRDGTFGDLVFSEPIQFWMREWLYHAHQSLEKEGTYLGRISSR